MASNSNSMTPVFGLTKDQLWPIVDNIVPGETVKSFDVTVEYQVRGHYGYSAEKVIPTLILTTQTGKKRKVSVFVKRFYEPGPCEAYHYANLQKHQAPIPRMYGSLTDSNRREIIFLEYLEPLHDVYPFHQFFNDAKRFHKFLAGAAHFNAIKPTGEYAQQLQCHDFSEKLTAARSTLSSLWDYACKGDLGENMKQLCSGSVDKLQRLQTLADKLVEPVSQMETGLVHYDLYPDSIGWRRETRELLLLDLEMVRFAPRFYDVAHWLGMPDDAQPRCCPRNELAQYYLDQYMHWGGSSVSLEESLKQISLLWLVQTFNILWFRLDRALDGRVDWTEDLEEGRCAYRAELFKDLTFLLEIVSENRGFPKL